MRLSGASFTNVGIQKNSSEYQQYTQNQNNLIAVIGYAGRFPQAENTAQYWHNLDHGVDSVGDIPPDRWHPKACFDRRPATPYRTYCNQGGFLKNIDQFDHAFFSISEDEARCMDPKQRLLMQTVYHALENAGYGGDAFCGTDTGVFIGSSYYHHEHEMPAKKVISPFGMLGTSNTLLANRISHVFNFKGPSCFIDTFCSSSILAVHMACQSLNRGECRTAIAGGVHLLSLIHYVSLSQFRALSATGRCRTFDQAADGFVPGEGIGIVVLKPLVTALNQGDTIHAVIRGAAVNHTGRTSSLTSPSAESQSQLIQAAYSNNGIDCNTISYIETHGTGTKLGDPLEIKALIDAFKGKFDERGHCVLGSVKTSIGHLEPASGIASLIKVILCFKHKRIPGVLHFNKLNQFINLQNSPFEINAQTIPWNSNGIPRRAGISSFGLSGTNVHMVVEEPSNQPSNQKSRYTRKLRLYTLSTKYRQGLARMAHDTEQLLDHYNDDDLDNICFTQAVGRQHFDIRTFILCSSIGELKVGLRKVAQKAENNIKFKEEIVCRTKDSQHEVAIAFNGDFFEGKHDVSSLWPYPAFRSALNQAICRIAESLPGDMVKDTILSEPHQSLCPALTFPYHRLATAYAIFKLLCSWGLKPVFITGWGTGFISAAIAADAISWEKALTLEDQLTNSSTKSAAMTIERHPTICLISGPVWSTDHGVIAGDVINIGKGATCDKRCQGSEGKILQPGTMIVLGGKLWDNSVGRLPQDIHYVHLSDEDCTLWSSLCKSIGELYIKGADINWPAFFQPNELFRIPWSNYPFANSRLQFELDREPTIMKMLLNLFENGYPESESQKNDTIQKKSTISTSRPNDSDELIAYLMTTVARKAGIKIEELEPDTHFEEIGMDSILKVELSYEIMERFAELEQAGNALVAAETINEFVDIIRQSVNCLPSSTIEASRMDSSPPDLEILHAGQKHRHENLASRICRVENQRFIADLTVNEQHPFFFDHPLDHVSGIHQLEAMVQAATTFYYDEKFRGAYYPLFFKDVHVEFKQLCPKTGAARVEVNHLDYINGCSNSIFYGAGIKTKHMDYCKAYFKVQALDTSDPARFRTKAASASKQNDFAACEKSEVNKTKDLNVLIGKPIMHDNSIRGMIFALRPVGTHTYFSDYTGEYVPSIYFLEAFRQTQRYLQHTQKENTESADDRVSFLISLSLSLFRPVSREEHLQLRVDHLEQKSVGTNLLVDAFGSIMNGNDTLGSCRNQNLVMLK